MIYQDGKRTKPSQAKPAASEALMSLRITTNQESLSLHLASGNALFTPSQHGCSIY
jgi:hypothetical protein